jgi:glycosyltransferase involved in cell wall biosynthesis
LNKLYIDATLPFRWGPHPPVGIPRVETALIRQALRRKGAPIGFFIVDSRGRGQLLNDAELHYLSRLVGGELPQPAGGGASSYLARLWKVLSIMQSAPFVFGREFDRVAATFVSGTEKRRGLKFQLSKTLIRLFKIVKSCLRGRRVDKKDPLKDAEAVCFLSSASVHAIAANKLAAGIKCNVFTIVHDLIPIDFPQFFSPHHARNFARDTAWQLENSDLVVCVSQYTAERVRCHLAASDPDRVPLVAVASPGAFLKEAVVGPKASVEGPAAGRKFVLYCSTIEIRKNHILLLKVWHRLWPVLGDRLPTLVFCGRWGWMYDELVAFMAAHPELREHVEFRPNLTDEQLADLYRGAEFSAYPSAVEGWGLGAAECLDFGLPVLISDAPSLTEATQGLMPTIPAHDVEVWCAAVAKACTNPAWLAELREKIASQYRPILEQEFFATIVDHVAALGSSDPGHRIRWSKPLATGTRQRPTELATEEPAFRQVDL